MEDTGEVEQKFEPLWRINERKSKKSGNRSTIYWVKKNPRYDEFQKNGTLVVPSEPSKFRTGDSYSGGWLHDKKNGFGTWETEKYRYQGDFEDGKRNGTGTLWIKSRKGLRKCYTGEWRDNKKHGIGVFYEKNGNTYEGGFDMGQKSGRGKLFLANGDVYDGEFENNQKCGLGILVLHNGDRYEGHWFNDMKEGPGRFFYKKTGKIFQGEWCSDSPKCGVYSEWEEQSGEDAYKIPELGLAEPENVLNEAFAQTRRERAENLGELEGAGAKEKKESSSALTEDELNDIVTAFNVLDSDGQGYVLGSEIVLVLNELGIYPLEEDVNQLLDELGADTDSQISLNAFIGLLVSLRAPEEEEDA